VSLRRVIFLNRFFHPDHSATSQIVSDLAFHLAASGADVHVITSGQLYDLPRATLAKEELVNGVHVHRVATTRFGRSGLAGRAIDYASYYAMMGHRARALAGRGDVLVAKTDPPLTSVVALRVAVQKNARLVNWLQDVYPETAAELGVPLMRGPLGRVLCRLRDQSLRDAAANVVVGERMAERVRSLAASVGGVHVIPNWCDDVELRPVRQQDNPLRHEWGLEQKFVVGYSGNLGRAHELDTVLSAAALLRDHPRVVFLFIGGGRQFDQLARSAKEHGLDRTFRFIAYQPQEILKYSLNVPDVHLVSLRPQLEGLIVPSKFYGIAAVGRPIISITASDGEIARLVRKHECGLVVEPGDGPALARALTDLAADPPRVAQMGTRARAMLDRNFARARALARWRALLEGIGGAA
jgi:colanic acid biosynthesis glycosyl transferase WcaI